MPEYHVTWEIDLHEDDPVAAARYALEIQRNPESTATVFDVTDEHGLTYHVDLEDEMVFAKREGG